MNQQEREKFIENLRNLIIECDDSIIHRIHTYMDMHVTHEFSRDVYLFMKFLKMEGGLDDLWYPEKKHFGSVLTLDVRNFVSFEYVSNPNLKGTFDKIFREALEDISKKYGSDVIIFGNIDLVHISFDTLRYHFKNFVYLKEKYSDEEICYIIFSNSDFLDALLTLANASAMFKNDPGAIINYALDTFMRTFNNDIIDRVGQLLYKINPKLLKTLQSMQRDIFTLIHELEEEMIGNIKDRYDSY